MQIQEFFTILPHLDTLTRPQAEQLLPKLRQFLTKIDDQSLGLVLFKLTEFIMSRKNINPDLLDFFETCIKDTIKIAIHKKLVVGNQALRNIFVTDAEFYKHVRLDIDLKHPLGLRHPINNYYPQVGEECDIVKPYLSAITYCGWTRCTVIAKDGNKLVVKYANTQFPTDTKQQPFCAPLGTRTLDFDWRMNLNVGDQLDAFHKVWYRATVKGLEIVNGVKRVTVTFKTFSQNGAKVDKFGQRYDGLDDQQDQFYDVTSYRIQMPGKMAKNFCEYSIKSEQFVLDDTYDIIFEKEYNETNFVGLTRLNFTRSVAYLEFYEVFCEQGGNEAFLQLLENCNKNYIDPVFNMAIVIANSSFLVPKMAVNKYLPQMLNKYIKFIYEHAKSLSTQRNQMSYFFIQAVAKRIMSLSEKYALVNEIRKRLALDFLKYNMEKQMIALRMLYELANPMPKPYNQKERQQVNQFMRANNIFYQIIQPQTHEQILTRSTELIRYLLTAQIISFKQIEYLWNIYPPTDLRGRATVQKMIGDLSKSFYLEDAKKVIHKILSYKESELTADNLGLLRSLKEHKQLQDEDRLQILQAMWEIITMKTANITQQIEQECQKVFKSILPSLQSSQTKLQLLKLIMNRLREIKTLRNEFDILKEFIMTYPKKLVTNQILKIQQQPSHPTPSSQQLPLTIPQVINFLKQNNIYATIIDVFMQLKSQAKMKNVLWFTSFLFDYDSEPVDGIVRVFYEKMGPSEGFFGWAQYVTAKAHQFFLDFFNNIENMNKFENLSTSGLDALKTILFDVNIREGNLKIVKKAKSVAIQSNEAGSSQKPFIGPLAPGSYSNQKQQIITFLYLLRSPYQCKGMQFMEQLLLVVKQNKVYDQIIKLIIQFFVNLDESIEDRTRQFREQFLLDIIGKFREVNEKNHYDDKIKVRLEMNVNLLQQLFSETEKDGLFDIRPHFECVQGEVFKFKAENHISKNKVLDPRIQINQNSTLYSLKVKLGQAFGEKPQQLVVFKFNTPVSDEHNGKSLTDLHFYNDETIKVERKSAKEIPRKQLLNETGQSLTPKFEAIVEKWFHTYKDQRGYMGLDELKKLSSELWKGSAMKQTAKLVEIIQKFDQSSKGCLTEQQFKQFFIYKSAQNPSAIWKILNLSGYKNNLRYKDEPEPVVNTSQLLPRRILSAPMVYQTLYALLQNKTFQGVHLTFYRLLNILQTDNGIKQQVKKENKNLLQGQPCIYRLSYILQTIYAQITTNDDFFVEFYRNRGCEIILQMLKGYTTEQAKSLYSLDTLTKTIMMPNMIKILNLYVYCLYSENQVNRYLRKGKINSIEMELMTTQLKKLDQVIGAENQFQKRLERIKAIEPYLNVEEIRFVSEKIVQNLIENYANQLLQKITNQIARLYILMTLTANKLNFQLSIKGLKSQSLNYRRLSQNLTYLYLSNNQNQLKPFLELLLSSLPHESKSIYSYFFTLLEKVLEMYIDNNKDQQDDSEFIDLAGKLFAKLFDELPGEPRNSILTDKLLVGVLIVLNILVRKRQGVKKHFAHLKKDLFEKCLFFYHPRQRISQIEITSEMLKNQKQANHFKDYVKCKSEDSRKIMMEIIYHLHSVSADQDPHLIDQYILPVLNDLPQNKKKFDTRSLQVGLGNLGSTCYLNSMIQALNSIPAFRNLIMQTDVDTPLVKELKNIFAYLYFSQRQDYTPQNFLQSFVPPIAKGIQQDTTEFLNILLDQLENSLKGTPSQNLLEEIFQGTQVAQMICESCKKKRERQETFFTYSVEIQGKYDLNSALEAMHNGQVISDCLCEQCGQRSDTIKRTIIENVPNMFFIPLRRIVFNYDMFLNTKIHTRLQFPSELNFEPYTKEGVQLRQSLGVEYMRTLDENEEEKKNFQQLCLHGRDPSYYKLKLKAIIVHSGGAQVGHYWAITKKQNNWVKFDDSKVMVFPHSSMESECYGGNYQNDQWGGTGASTNAYVLLYEKEVKQDIVLDKGSLTVPFDKIQTYNSEKLYKQVWLDNHSLMLQNHLLRQSYCKEFLHFLVQILYITPASNKIKIIAETLYKVCYHSGETNKLIDAFMVNLDQIDPLIFRDYVLADKGRTFDLLFHNNLSVREFMAVFLERVLVESWKKGSEEDKANVFKFIDEYLGLLHHDAAKNWLRIDGYFKLFEGLVARSLEIKELYDFLISKQLIAYFIDFILEKGSPLNIYPKKYSIGSKTNPANFSHGINLIFMLLKNSYGFTGENYEIAKANPQFMFHLSDNEVICLSSIAFYEKMIRERQNLNILGQIIQRLSIKNLAFSEAIARSLLVCLNEITDSKDQMIDICGCISKYLIIADEFWVNRAEFVLGCSAPYIYLDNLLAALDEERFVYVSTLEDLFPVECLLAYCHINRLRNPLAVLHILRTILQGCSVSETSRQYLLSQKSPSYFHERYIDWVRPYVNNVVQTLTLSGDKKQSILKQVEICNNYLNDLQPLRQPMHTGITGKLLNQNVVDRFTKDDIEVVISNVECYMLKSEPTGFGNRSLDDYLEHGRLNKQVTKDSNILCLFKQFSQPLALRQGVEEAEDKELQSLFDDCVGSKTEDKKMQVEQPQNQQPEIKAEKNITEAPLPTEMKQQPKLHQINVPGIYVSPDYFRKIEIINNSAKSKRVTLKIHRTPESNMLVPSKFHQVSSKKAVETKWICKVDETKGWGVVDYELIVEDKDQKPSQQVPKSFKLYGEMQQYVPDKMEVQEYNNGTSSNNYQGQMPSNPLPYDDMMDEISCPVCTLLNLPTQTECEACGTPLRG